ncbi:MAG: hypothetical protein ABFS86_04520 [Planctomycetota bacterium]
MTAETGPTSRRRKWAFRLTALLLPLGLLLALEVAFRLTGVGALDPWENRHVNYVSGERFFPRWDETIAMPKPEGVTRIFVLGGSAVMGYRMESFPDLLPRELAARRPGRYEVINGGMVAFGSHRVFEVMKEAARFDPDLVVVYTGHNEFLEEIFFDEDGFLARQEAFAAAVGRLRVIRWLRGLVGSGPIELPRPDVQRHFVGNRSFPLIRDREQYDLRLRFLDSNVAQMIALAEVRGFALLLAPAVPNLLHAPGNPVNGPGYEGREIEWTRAFEAGRDAWREGRVAEASTAFARAAEIDGEHALLVYLRGLVDLAEGRDVAGVERLIRALDLDRRGDRANSEVAGVIRERAAASGAPFLDARSRLFERVPEDVARVREGRDGALFIDHCHFSAEGHRRMAAQVAGAAAPLLPNK